jgi:hypothetical protein
MHVCARKDKNKYKKQGKKIALDSNMFVSSQQSTMSMLVHLLRSSLSLQKINHTTHGFLALVVERVFGVCFICWQSGKEIGHGELYIEISQ